MLAKQWQILSREKGRAERDELIAARVKMGLRLLGQRELVFVPGYIADHPNDGFVVMIDDPGRVAVRVDEKARLVRVVLFDCRIAIEMIRAEIGEDTDNRLEARRVVQLERRHLE